MRIFNTSFVDVPMSTVPVDLNAFFKKISSQRKIDFNSAEAMGQEIRQAFGNCWGGYSENRSYMWSGTYLAKQRKFYHLGIDINVPAGTPVHAPFDCGVLDASVHEDTHIGWGGRYILKKQFCPNLVLCHIDPMSMAMPLNCCFKKGEVIGQVGNYPTNGNVWPHLHVQCYMSNDWDNLDGYGVTKDLELCPNPYEVEWGN